MWSQGPVNGEESLALVDQHDFDVVLMDIRMAGMSGPEAAREIKLRTEKRGLTVPVIAVSAAITAGDLEIFRSNGMDEYIPKPFEEEQLVKAILSVIKYKPPVPVYDLSSIEANQ